MPPKKPPAPRRVTRSTAQAERANAVPTPDDTDAFFERPRSRSRKAVPRPQQPQVQAREPTPYALSTVDEDDEEAPESHSARQPNEKVKSQHPSVAGPYSAQPVQAEGRASPLTPIPNSFTPASVADGPNNGSLPICTPEAQPSIDREEPHALRPPPNVYGSPEPFYVPDDSDSLLFSSPNGYESTRLEQLRPDPCSTPKPVEHDSLPASPMDTGRTGTSEHVEAPERLDSNDAMAGSFFTSPKPPAGIASPSTPRVIEAVLNHHRATGRVYPKDYEHSITPTTTPGDPTAFPSHIPILSFPSPSESASLNAADHSEAAGLLQPEQTAGLPQPEQGDSELHLRERSLAFLRSFGLEDAAQSLILLEEKAKSKTSKTASNPGMSSKAKGKQRAEPMGVPMPSALDSSAGDPALSEHALPLLLSLGLDEIVEQLISPEEEAVLEASEPGSSVKRKPKLPTRPENFPTQPTKLTARQRVILTKVRNLIRALVDYLWLNESIDPRIAWRVLGFLGEYMKGHNLWNVFTHWYKLQLLQLGQSQWNEKEALQVYNAMAATDQGRALLEKIDKETLPLTALDPLSSTELERIYKNNLASLVRQADLMDSQAGIGMLIIVTSGHPDDKRFLVDFYESHLMKGTVEQELKMDALGLRRLVKSSVQHRVARAGVAPPPALLKGVEDTKNPDGWRPIVGELRDLARDLLFDMIRKNDPAALSVMAQKQNAPWKNLLDKCVKYKGMVINYPKRPYPWPMHYPNLLNAGSQKEKEPMWRAYKADANERLQFVLWTTEEREDPEATNPVVCRRTDGEVFRYLDWVRHKQSDDSRSDVDESGHEDGPIKARRRQRKGKKKAAEDDHDSAGSHDSETSDLEDAIPIKALGKRKGARHDDTAARKRLKGLRAEDVDRPDDRLPAHHEPDQYTHTAAKSALPEMHHGVHGPRQSVPPPRTARTQYATPFNGLPPVCEPLDAANANPTCNPYGPYAQAVPLRESSARPVRGSGAAATSPYAQAVPQALRESSARRFRGSGAAATSQLLGSTRLQHSQPPTFTVPSYSATAAPVTVTGAPIAPVTSSIPSAYQGLPPMQRPNNYESMAGRAPMAPYAYPSGTAAVQDRWTSSFPSVSHATTATAGVLPHFNPSVGAGHHRTTDPPQSLPQPTPRPLPNPNAAQLLPPSMQTWQGGARPQSGGADYARSGSETHRAPQPQRASSFPGVAYHSRPQDDGLQDSMNSQNSRLAGPQRPPRASVTARINTPSTQESYPAGIYVPQYQYSGRDDPRAHLAIDRHDSNAYASFPSQQGYINSQHMHGPLPSQQRSAYSQPTRIPAHNSPDIHGNQIRFSQQQPYAAYAVMHEQAGRPDVADSHYYTGQGDGMTQGGPGGGRIG